MTVTRSVLERLAVVETHFSEIKTDLSSVKQDIRSLLAFQAARQAADIKATRAYDVLLRVSPTLISAVSLAITVVLILIAADKGGFR